MDTHSNYLKYILPNFLDNNHTNFSIFPQQKYIIINDRIMSNKFNCPICLESQKALFRPNTCNHCFCKKCINNWSIIKRNCPICRLHFNYIIKL